MLFYNLFTKYYNSLYVIHNIFIKIVIIVYFDYCGIYIIYSFSLFSFHSSIKQENKVELSTLVNLNVQKTEKYGNT